MLLSISGGCMRWKVARGYIRSRSRGSCPCRAAAARYDIAIYNAGGSTFTLEPARTRCYSDPGLDEAWKETRKPVKVGRCKKGTAGKGTR